MLGSFRNLQDRVDIHHAFLHPIRVAVEQLGDIIRPAIELAAQESYLDLRSRVANDKLRFLHTEKIAKEPPGDIVRMSDRLGAEPEAGSRSQLLGIAQTKFFSGVQDLMRSAFRRTEVDKLIDIVHTPVAPRMLSATMLPLKAPMVSPSGLATW